MKVLFFLIKAKKKSQKSDNVLTVQNRRIPNDPDFLEYYLFTLLISSTGYIYNIPLFTHFCRTRKNTRERERDRFGFISKMQRTDR